MEAAAHTLVAIAPLILACLWPFVRIVRGRQVFASFFLCWALLVIWFLLFSIVIPLGVSWVSHRAGENLFRHWMPEAPIVVAMTLCGWFYAGITTVLAILVRDLARHFIYRTKPPTDA